MKANYRSLFIKGIVFFVLFVITDFLIGKIFRALEYKALDRCPYGMVTEYTMWKVDSDVVIIGASDATHSYIPSILEEGLGVSVYNCGNDGCRFYYQNAMVRGILERYRPKMIVWSISPTELSHQRDGQDNGLSRLNVFCRDNSFCRQVLRTKSKYEPIKLLSSSYIYNSCLFNYLYNIFVANYQYDKGYAPLYGMTNRNADFGDERLIDEYDSAIGQIFIETIEQCLQKNVKLCFIFTPRFKIQDYKSMESYLKLKAIVNEYHIPLIEKYYHFDDLMKAECFKDNSHLNHQGATLYGKLLVDELKPLIGQ